MRVKMEVENIGDCSVLVDSGAQRSLVSEQLLDESIMRRASHSQQYWIKALGEDNSIRSAGRVELSVYLSGIQMTAPFIVVPASIRLSTPILIGSDFLKLHNLEVVLSERRLTKKFDCGTCLDIFVEEAGTCQSQVRRVKCTAASSVSVARGELTCIPITLQVPDELKEFVNGEHLYFFESSSQPRSHEVYSGIVDVNNLHILLENTGTSRKVVKVNQVMGEVSSVLELSCTEQETTPKIDVMEKINLDHLDKTTRDEVSNMLQSCITVFSEGSSDVGLAAVTAHEIHLTEDTPIYQRPRRFPEPIAEEIEKQCRELHSLDIIEPSGSSWSSPVVPIRKKDGTLRLCIDYRRLNHVTKPDRYPLPNLIDSVYSLKGNKYFTTLDLVRGYYQVPIHENSRPYTAFSTSHSHWQFKRLSFGLKNAPSSFQREMQAVLREFPWSRVVIYIDDILIMEETYEKHLTLVEKVLQTLSGYGMKIKPEKCQWFMPSVDFLGHVIGRTGIRKEPAYVEKVEQFPLPETVVQLQEFLGLVNFQRKFIPNCSTIQKALSLLTGGRKKAKIEWTEERMEAFQKLKEAMRLDVELAYPDYSAEAPALELSVDASATGAGACLAQMQGGRLQAIAFASMCFTHTQRNYSTLDRELAALRWAVKYFKAFLYGIDFILKTDHQPLVYLHNMRLVDSRLARTLEDLSDFSFTIVYVPGKLNVVADGLSRIPAGDAAIPCTGNSLPPGLVIDGSPVPGGGDSLFESVIISLERNTSIQLPSSAEELRHLLLEEMLRSPSEYGYTNVTKHTRRDLRLMKIKGQLPCLEVLLALSSLYKTIVLVYFWSGQPVVFRHHSVGWTECQGVIHLQCLSGIHFNPLRTTPGYRLPDVGSWLSVPDEPDKDDPSGEIKACVSQANVEPELSCHRCNESEHPRVLVQLADNCYCALIDTGAEISLVQKSVFDQCQEPLSLSLCEDDTVKIEGYTGKLSDTGGTVNIQLVLPGCMTSHLHPFAIVEDDLIPHCFLLGADFIVSHCLALDMYDMQLKQLGGEVIAKLLCTVEADLMLPELMSNEDPEDHESQTAMLPFFARRNEDWIQKIQKDGVIPGVRDCLTSNIPVSDWPEKLMEYTKHCDKLEVIQDLLLYKAEYFVCVVPFQALQDLVHSTHRSMAHIGREKLLDLLRKNVWHPKLSKIVEDICTTCSKCQLNKISSQRVIPPTLKIKSTHPFDLVAADLVQFPRTMQGNIGCLVVVDHFSKWLSVVPIRNKTAKTVVNMLEHRILPTLPRMPDRMLTDNGPEFSSEIFSAMLTSYGIKHIFTTPYRPASNGCVERVNRTIGEFLKNIVESPGSWDTRLGKAVMVYNNTKHSELGMSPAEFLLTKPHSVLDSPIIVEEDLLWSEGHPKYEPFHLGQLVKKKRIVQDRSVANKFKPKYDGPFEVIKINDNKVTYKIRKIDNGQVILAHHSQLIRWNKAPPYLQGYPEYRAAIADGDPNYPEKRVTTADEVDDARSESSFTSSSTDDDYSYESIAFSSESEDFSGFEKLHSTSASNVKSKSSFYQPSAVRTATKFRDSRFIIPDDFSNHCVLEEELQVPDQQYSQPENELLSSGIVLPIDDELWDVSTIQSGNECKDLTVDKDNKHGALYKRLGEIIQEMAFRLLNVACDRLVEAVETSSPEDSSFSGFHSLFRERSREHSNLATSDIMVSQSSEEKTLETVQNLDGIGRSCTRSQGNVPDLPNVQPFTLEYTSQNL